MIWGWHSTRITVRSWQPGRILARWLMVGTYLPACLQRAVSGGELVALPAMRRRYPAHPPIGTQLIQSLELLDKVCVQLSRPQRHATHGTTRRVRLELLLAWGREDVRQTESHGVWDHWANKGAVRSADCTGDSPLARLPACPTLPDFYCHQLPLSPFTSDFTFLSALPHTLHPLFPPRLYDRITEHPELDTDTTVYCTYMLHATLPFSPCTMYTPTPPLPITLPRHPSALAASGYYSCKVDYYYNLTQHNLKLFYTITPETFSICIIICYTFIKVIRFKII